MSTYAPTDRYFACADDACTNLTHVADTAPDDFEPFCREHPDVPMAPLTFDEFVALLPEDERPRPAEPVDEPEEG